MSISTLFTKFFENGRRVDDLSVWLGKNLYPVSSLTAWQRGFPSDYSYQSFTIPKRNGHGTRTIHAPNPLLKKLQRHLYCVLLRGLKTHPSCCGFLPRKSILNAALPHVKAGVLINMDLKDYFASTKERSVYQMWRRLGWGRSASKILTRMCCLQGNLPTGAPTSPMLSNVLNYRLDYRLSALCHKKGGHYTRYADDLSFSFPTLRGREKLILKQIANIIKDSGYQIQKNKRVRIQRSHQRQTVTGLVVNTRVNLPRTMRRTIRAMKYRAQTGQLNKEQLRRLEGFLALQKMLSKV